MRYSDPFAEHIAVVRRTVEEFYNAGNIPLAKDLFAPDFVNHDLMLLANPLHAASAAKCDVRVFARGTSFNHATVRVMFMPAAVRMFWRWVRANPT